MGRKCLVTGSASQIASWLVPRLIETECEPHVVSRGRRPDYGPGVHWHHLDLADIAGEFPSVGAEVLFHTAQIDLLPPWIERARAAGVTRIIAFSTTGIFTKANSGNRAEREAMAALAQAERQTAQDCPERGIGYTIFRPTLIHGGRFGDRNVSDIAGVISRFGFFPLYGRGSGLRQPVHAADLAEACLLACDRPATFARAYDLGGGEILTYRRMVERIFEAMGRRPRFVRAPEWAFSLAIAIARKRPGYRHLTADMALRMKQDLVAEIASASRDFGYSPRAFNPVIPA